MYSWDQNIFNAFLSFLKWENSAAKCHHSLYCDVPPNVILFESVAISGINQCLVCYLVLSFPFYKNVVTVVIDVEKGIALAKLESG